MNTQMIVGPKTKEAMGRRYQQRQFSHVKVCENPPTMCTSYTIM